MLWKGPCSLGASENGSLGHVQVRGTPFRLWESVDVGWGGQSGFKRELRRGAWVALFVDRRKEPLSVVMGGVAEPDRKAGNREIGSHVGAPLNGIHLWRWRQGPCRDAGIPLPVWVRAVGKSPPNDPVLHPVLFHRLLFHEALQDAQWGRGSLLNQRGWEEAISTGQTITWLLSSHQAPPLPPNAVRAST